MRETPFLTICGVRVGFHHFPVRMQCVSVVFRKVSAQCPRRIRTESVQKRHMGKHLRVKWNGPRGGAHTGMFNSCGRGGGGAHAGIYNGINRGEALEAACSGV